MFPSLKFSVQLQHHARHQLPTFQLIFVHVIESLVFVPVWQNTSMLKMYSCILRQILHNLLILLL